MSESRQSRVKVNPEGSGGDEVSLGKAGLSESRWVKVSLGEANGVQSEECTAHRTTR